METTRSYNDPDATANYERTTLAAAFSDRDSAHDAMHRLHDEGFGDTWLGITKSDDTASYGAGTEETRVEADNWFMRFFGEGDESLHDALVRHGVSEVDAVAAGSLPAHSAIVTVDGANHPELAAQIISQAGGRLITKGFGSMGYGTSGTYAPAATGALGMAAAGGAIASGHTMATDTSLSGVAPYDVSTDIAPTAGASLGSVGSATDDRLATDVPITASDRATALDYGSYRGGQTIDDETRLQLREERLRIDKERRSIGSATISKDIVTQTQEVDVPLIREELFIERRAVNSTTAVIGEPIGTDTSVINIPLTEEKVSVTKVPVVTEEIVVGKRQVEEIGHVSETIRKEQLSVVDVDATAVTGTTTTAPRI